MIGYKMTRPDGKAFYDSKTEYAIGATITVDGPTHVIMPTADESVSNEKAKP